MAPRTFSKTLSTTLAAVFTLVWSVASDAQVSDRLPVQGYLTDSAGDPVDGSTELAFALYTEPSGGEAIWEELVSSADVDAGYFSVYLGEQTPLDVLAVVDAPALWLEVSVGSEVLGRVEVGSVPWAIEAIVSEQVGSLREQDIQPLLVDACPEGQFLQAWDPVGNAPLCETAPSADQAQIEAWAQAVCFDTTSELTDELDGTYLGVGYQPAWGELQGVPAGFADGVDDDTQLSAQQVGSIVSAAGFARATELVDDDPSTSPLGWADITNVPAGFDDGVDNDTTYEAGEGLDLSEGVFSARGSPFGNVVTVALSGGDFTSVQAAVDHIAGLGDASPASPYVIRIGPGTYTGPVDLVPHVHLRGAGQSATIVTSDRGGAAHPGMLGTVTMAGDTSLRDLTVHSSASTGVTTGVLVDDAAVGVSLSSIRILVDGAAGASRGVVVRHRATVDVRDVAIRIENASSSNRPVEVVEGSHAMVRDSHLVAVGGLYPGGAQAWAGNDSEDPDYGPSGAELVNVRIDVTGGTTSSYGIVVFNDSRVIAHGGTWIVTAADGSAQALSLNAATAVVSDVSIEALGGDTAFGLRNLEGGRLEANNVIVDVSGAAASLYGLFANNAAESVLRGVVIDVNDTGGADTTFGLDNVGSSLELVGAHVSVSGTGQNTYGLRNLSGAQASFDSSELTVRGVDNAFGVANEPSSKVTLAGVTVLVEDADENVALLNQAGGTIEVRGGTATARGSGERINVGLRNHGAAQVNGTTLRAFDGLAAYAVENRGAAARLEAGDLAAAAEIGATDQDGLSIGLLNWEEATATVSGGRYWTGTNGAPVLAYTVLNSSSTLEVHGAHIAAGALPGGPDTVPAVGLSVAIGAIGAPSQALVSHTTLEGYVAAGATSGADLTLISSTLLATNTPFSAEPDATVACVLVTTDEGVLDATCSGLAAIVW